MPSGAEPLSESEAVLASLLEDFERFAHPDIRDFDAREAQADLHRRLSACLSDPDCSSRTRCCTVISHHLFLSHLHIFTVATQPGCGSHSRLFGEVKLNFLLVFIEKFSRTGDLGYRPEIGQDHISGWLRAVMLSLLPGAWRQTLKYSSRHRPLPKREVSLPQDETLRLDVYDFIKELPDLQRALAFLLVEGYKPREIAERLACTREWVYRNRPKVAKRLMEFVEQHGRTRRNEATAPLKGLRLSR